MHWITNWEQGVRSNWGKYNSKNPCNNYNLNIDTPFVISRLNRDFVSDTNMESNDDSDDETDTDTFHQKFVENGKRVVHKTPLFI